MGHRLYFKVKAISVAVLFLLSCNDLDDCIKGTGEVMSEERSVGLFDGITVSDDINLVILNDTARNLVVEAGENLLPGLRTEVLDGMLYLRNDNVCKYLRSYQKEILVKAYVNDLKKVAFAGSARITSGNILSFDYFLMWLDGARGEINLQMNIEQLVLEQVSGNGLTRLSGEVRDGIINSKAQGLLYLKELKIRNLKMVANSYNDAYIWVTDTMDIAIGNLGNVYCRGNPYIKSYKRTGKGQLIIIE